MKRVLFLPVAVALIGGFVTACNDRCDNNSMALIGDSIPLKGGGGGGGHGGGGEGGDDSGGSAGSHGSDDDSGGSPGVNPGGNPALYGHQGSNDCH